TNRPGLVCNKIKVPWLVESSRIGSGDISKRLSRFSLAIQSTGNCCTISLGQLKLSTLIREPLP
ncbi:hypothetical protein L873DRAFT_1823070, partial [Choiromyces venosus 120613-1]